MAGIPYRSLVLGACLAAAGCNESDLTSIRLALEADGSGSIRVSALEVPQEPFAVERESSGATWSDRIGVKAVAGSFAAVSDLAVAGITFDAGATGSGIHYLDVTVPVGPGSPWVAAIAPLSEAQRAASARAFDPTGRVQRVGSTVSIVVELPGEVTGSSVTPHRRGVTASMRNDSATLLVPVDAPDLGTVIWHVTWTQG